MTLADFLLEYGSTLFGCYAVGWGSGYFLLSFKKVVDMIF